MSDIGSRTDRDRSADLAADLDRSGSAPAPAALAVLCRTVVLGVYPTTAPAYFAVEELFPGGVEVEGGTPGYSAGSTFYAANVGANVPPPGTVLIADGCGGRFVFRY